MVASTAPLAPAAVTSDDSDFLKSAAKGGMAEVELGAWPLKRLRIRR